MLHRVPTHLIGSPEVWLILYLIQYLMHRLSEHCINHLSNSRSSVPSKIPSRPIIVVPIRLEIPPILGDYLSLPFSLLLVLLNPFILINTIQELAYTPSRLPCQRLSQIMFGRRADFESSYGHIIKILIYFFEHLSVLVRVRL